MRQRFSVEADYAKFAARVANLASALQTRLGIRPGDRIAIVMSNCVEYLELLYATWFAGAVVVPINFKLHAKEAAWIIEHAEAKAVFVSESVAAELIPLIETLPGLAAAVRRATHLGADASTGLPRPRRSSVAVLYLRDHRQAEGGHDFQRQPARHGV